jgi:hypothetical protein
MHAADTKEFLQISDHIPFKKENRPLYGDSERLNSLAGELFIDLQ